MNFDLARASKALILSALFSSISPLSALTTPSISGGAMPVTFESNQGQTAPEVKFISRGASGVLLLGPSEITLRTPGQADQFSLKLLDANPAASIVGTGDNGGTVNYLRGNQPSAWLTNIPSYTQVTYKNIYPNIDLKVYGNHRQFESDFVVNRNADPSNIALQIDGHLQIGHDGSLAIESASGTFQLHRPFVYQLASNGDRVAVDSHYTIGSGNHVGFFLGQYDHNKSLIIDPVLSYSTYLGGSEDEQILGITGDILSNVYVTGQTSSIDFPTAGPLQSKEGGDQDCFISKLDHTGQHLLYSTYLGGSLNDKCSSIAVNLLGEVVVGGTTNSTNFPTLKAMQPSLKVSGSNTSDGFVAHLNCTGSQFIFSTYLGGGGEFLTGVALDLLSNVYVTGLTAATDFPVTKGAFQTTCGQNCYDNAFLTKLTPLGAIVFSTYLGGSSYDSSNGIAVDATGSVYLAGQATSPNFPTTKNAYQPKIAGYSNAFVTKFSPDGSSLVYSTYIGGSNFDGARGIAVDLFGNAYIAGNTNSLNFPTVNAFQNHFTGTGYEPENIFVLKLNSTGTALDYSTYVGGSSYDYPFGISVDSQGNASVIGETTSTNFPVKSAIQPTFGGGVLDAFVLSFNTNGVLNFSTYLGGSNDEYGFAIYSDPFGCVWIGGQTYSTNFPLVTPYQSKLKGTSDAFLTRITTP